MSDWEVDDVYDRWHVKDGLIWAIEDCHVNLNWWWDTYDTGLLVYPEGFCFYAYDTVDYNHVVIPCPKNWMMLW